MWSVLLFLALAKPFIFRNAALSGLWSRSGIFIVCLKPSLHLWIGMRHDAQCYWSNIAVIGEKKPFSLLGLGECAHSKLPSREVAICIIDQFSMFEMFGILERKILVNLELFMLKKIPLNQSLKWCTEFESPLT